MLRSHSVMLSFLIETRKVLLDHLVKMHDQFIMDLLRHSKRVHEAKHRELRKRLKKAIDVVLDATKLLINWPEGRTLNETDIYQQVDKDSLLTSISDLKEFKYLEERGYADIILARYPSLRKYFSRFIKLPFEAKTGTESLLKSIQVIRELDSKTLGHIPDNVVTGFIPKELIRSLKDTSGKVRRNAWEMGIAISIKEALRSGDLFLPKSKQHASFWGLMMDYSQWQKCREAAYEELQQPFQQSVKSTLTLQFHSSVGSAVKQFELDSFASIVSGKLKLKLDDKASVPDTVIRLQKLIDSAMPQIRIEQLLMEVDQETQFSRHFIPIQQHRSRPKNFYQTLIASLISQSTNLGIVSTSASVRGVSVDMMRHLLQFYVREETVTAASAEIVNQHHKIPFSEVHGTGELSSSDAQRFKIRADSLLASYYPRYYGYYEKAIGIYTHASDQYSVYSTKVISCNPREALYVLDG